MTMLNADGTLLSKEIYKYEFDFAGQLEQDDHFGCRR